MKRKLIFCFSFVSFMVTVLGQQFDVASKLGYPDLVLYNAKIVTMDDPSFESTVGTIVEAMAVRKDKILAIGSNAEPSVVRLVKSALSPLRDEYLYKIRAGHYLSDLSP